MSDAADKFKESFVLKVCVVGDGGVGKTSIVMRYCDGVFRENYIMTIGSNFAVKNLPLPEIETYVKLQLWDLAGQPHFSFVRLPFYKGSSGVIYVYDVTSQESLANLPAWKTEVEKAVSGLPSIVCANKIDLEPRTVNEENGREMTNSLGALDYFETSAKTGVNVHAAFSKLAEEVVRQNK